MKKQKVIMFQCNSSKKTLKTQKKPTFFISNQLQSLRFILKEKEGASLVKIVLVKKLVKKSKIKIL